VTGRLDRRDKRAEVLGFEGDSDDVFGIRSGGFLLFRLVSPCGYPRKGVRSLW
jgi:hypothetical protein